MKYYFLLLVYFFYIDPVTGQVILNPPCSGTVTVLGGVVNCAVCSPDNPCNHPVFAYEVCPSTNYGISNCGLGSGCSSQPGCFRIERVCANSLPWDPNILTYCTYCSQCMEPSGVDTVTLPNKHTLRFFQQNWYQGALVYQDSLSLRNRCINKDYGVKCKVAVDGAASTIIDVIGPDPSSIGIRPAAVPLDSNYNGYLNKYFVQPNVEAYTYFSPNGFSSPSDTSITFEVYDVNCPDWILATFQIKKMKVPVLMIHGLDSEPSTWTNLKNYLSVNGFDNIINNPPFPNDQTFETTYPLIQPQIQSMLDNYREQGININQVDVIGHSMGGILGRYHLQSDDYINQSNINKLITVNTPHSGSEFANLLYDGNLIVTWLNHLGPQINVNGGAIENLRVNSTAMMFMNSSTQKNYSKRAPIHAISTDYTGCTVTVNISQVSKLVAIANYFGYFKRFSTFNFNICPQDFVLGPQNDAIVRLSSQTGGLSSSASQTFTGTTMDYTHLSLGNTSLHSHIFQLLKSSTKSNYFTLSGFNPVELPAPELSNNVASDRSMVDISIDNFQNGDIIYTSSSTPQNLIITGSAGVMGTMVMYHFANGDIQFDSSFQSGNSYIINIPTGYTGRLDIGVIGTDGSGTVDFENVYIIIDQQPLPVELIHFDAKAYVESVKLNWTTTSEINCDDYEVMHSTDGYLFGVLSRIGCLNITGESNYQYLHQNPNKGVNYYRLKQIDNDGKEFYSKIVSINLNSDTPIQIFPNPTTGLINIQIKENISEKIVSYTINNQLGQIMSEGNLTDNYLEIGDYSEGIYFIHFTFDNETISFKVLKK